MMAHAGKTGKGGRGAEAVSRRTSSSRCSSASASEGVVAPRRPAASAHASLSGNKNALRLSAHGIVWCGATASGVASRAESLEDGESSSTRTQDAEACVGADQERGADSGRVRQVQDVQGTCAKVLATLDYLQRSRLEVQP